MQKQVFASRSLYVGGNLLHPTSLSPHSNAGLRTNFDLFPSLVCQRASLQAKTFPKAKVGLGFHLQPMSQLCVGPVHHPLSGHCGWQGVFRTKARGGEDLQPPGPKARCRANRCRCCTSRASLLRSGFPALGALRITPQCSLSADIIALPLPCVNGYDTNYIPNVTLPGAL